MLSTTYFTICLSLKYSNYNSTKQLTWFLEEKTLALLWWVLTDNWELSVLDLSHCDNVTESRVTRVCQCHSLYCVSHVFTYQYCTAILGRDGEEVKCKIPQKSSPRFLQQNRYSILIFVLFRQVWFKCFISKKKEKCKYWIPPGIQLCSSYPVANISNTNTTVDRELLNLRLI